MYDHIARYYDLSHNRLTDDIPYLLALARETEGPLLELGCGSGRLLSPLARAGFHVTGVDSSPEMLARARVRLAGEPADVRARVRLVEGDVRTLILPDAAPFALAFFGYNTFMHLNEVGAGTALRRVRPLLRPGGRLFIDVDNPLLLSVVADDPDFVLEDELRDETTGETIRQFTAYESAPVEQAVDVTWVYESTGDAGRAKARLRYHYLYPHQYDLLLALTGFRLIALAGDYDGAPFDEESDRLLILGVASEE